MEFNELFEKVKESKPLFQKEEVTFDQDNLRKVCEFFYNKGYHHAIKEDVEIEENRNPGDLEYLQKLFGFKNK